MTDKAFALIVEMKNQGPILLESEDGGLDACVQRAQAMPNVIRWCVVQLMPTTYGNALLLRDFLRMSTAPNTDPDFKDF